MKYKAFKFDNSGDLNIFDDGEVVLPTGVLKYTNEGIHGPEVQFLGRSLPIHNRHRAYSSCNSWYCIRCKDR